MKKSDMKSLAISTLASIIVLFILALIPLDKWLESLPLTLPMRLFIAGLILLFIFSILLYKYTRIRINADDILLLKDFGLKIHNEKILNDEIGIKKNNIVFFPVIPTPNFNTIHLIFSFFVGKLLDAGLKIQIFVFDDYCMRIDKNQKHINDNDVNNFILLLKRYIQKKKGITIIKESSFLKSKRKSKKILFAMLNKASELSYGDICNIQKDKSYIDENVQFSRFMKPLFNMLFLSLTSKEYGFTLSGEDERPLWELYNNKFSRIEGYKMCNFYIPTIRNSHARDTKNVCFNDSTEEITDKVTGNFDVASKSDVSVDSDISIVLRFLIFQNGNGISYSDDDGNNISINNWDNLLDKIFSVGKAEQKKIFEAIANNLKTIITSKKEHYEKVISK